MIILLFLVGAENYVRFHHGDFQELEERALFYFSLGFPKEEHGTKASAWVVYLGRWPQGAGGCVRMRWEPEEESQYNQGNHLYRGLTAQVLLEAL